MIQPDTPPESSTITELVRAVERARRQLDKSSVFPAAVREWTGGVRTTLRRAFGSDSRPLALWPTADTPFAKELARETLVQRVSRLEALISAVSNAAQNALTLNGGNRVFIGHGRSLVWRELKDFIVDRLALPWDEFNRESVAGLATSDRLDQMLKSVSFAFLIMTAEDEHADSKLHARENVVHEVGLFQGKLGSRRAIILLEEGCSTFSNIHGLSHVPFPASRISTTFEEIRRVLEREQIIES